MKELIELGNVSLQDILNTPDSVLITCDIQLRAVDLKRAVLDLCKEFNIDPSKLGE